MRFRPTWVMLALLAPLWVGSARAHDIPNARVDRSIQVEVWPGRIRVDYEVSLSELTLTQDLRALIGALPEGDRLAWFARYGTETGPLNARGFVLTVDGEPVELTFQGYDLTVEDHPRYTFHVGAEIPEQGKLRLIDSNYAASEGTSRLAIRGRAGVEIIGDAPLGDVEMIRPVPTWQLSPAEERRTKQVSVEYRPGGETQPTAPIEPAVSRERARSTFGLSVLLNRARTTAWPQLCALAFFLGIAHSIQPGHGKSLIAAGSLGPGGSRSRGLLLGLAATVGHLSSVAALAVVLWTTGATDFPAWNTLVLRASGLWLAAIGLWRLGRHLGDSGTMAPDEAPRPDLSTSGLLGLGLASGMVPCWDAVGLLVVATAVGRVGLGLVLLAAFSLGMGLVLVTVGLLAMRLQRQTRADRRWGKALGLLSGCLLALIGGLILMT